MKKIVVILILAMTKIGLVFAQAPNSIGGYVFRATEIADNHTTLQITLLFAQNGTYTVIMARGMGLEDVPTAMFPYLQPQTGTYVYQQTGVNSATLSFSNLSPPNLTPLQLTFTTAVSGSLSGQSGYYFGSFSLVTAALSGAVPLGNVSTLAWAGQGSPVQVGFILNGTQDVLIRAVGPSLASFGVSNVWANPSFTL